MTESILQNKKVSGIISAILLLVALAIAGYVMYPDVFTNDERTATDTQEDVLNLAGLESGDDILNKVGSLIMLPEEVDPVLIVLSNVKALQEEQPFYELASEGDYLVILPKAKKAIIYNADKNILVNVGPVIGDGSEE